jgi:hypothetical protein
MLRTRHPVLPRFTRAINPGDSEVCCGWYGGRVRMSKCVDVGTIEGAHRWDMCVWAHGGEVGEWNEKCTAAFGHIAGAARTLQYDFTEEGDRPSLSKTRVRAGRLPVMKLALWIQIGQGLFDISDTGCSGTSWWRWGGAGTGMGTAARKRRGEGGLRGCMPCE